MRNTLFCVSVCIIFFLSAINIANGQGFYTTYDDYLSDNLEKCDKMSKLGDHSVTFKKGKEKVTFNFSHGKIWGFRDNNNNLFRADKPSSKCYVVLTSGKICSYGTPALVKIYQAPNGSTNYYLQKGMSLQKTLAISKGDTGEIFPIDNEILVQIFGDDSELLEKIKNDKVRTGIGTDLDADFPKILAWVAEYNSRN